MASVIELIKSDLARKCNNYFLENTFFERYVKTTLQLGSLAVVAYRLGAWCEQCPSRLLRWLCLLPCQGLNALMLAATGISINRSGPIGPGFIIHNFSAIHIDAAAIGDNFTVNQGVTVDSDWRGNGRPVIGNNVYLGSGAKVLGNITIGDNVIVAANALVDQSVPDNCTVVGVPARVISRDASSTYLRFASK